MKIAITDANIFIDLIRLQLLGYLFGIDLEIYVTREVIEQLNTIQSEKISSFIQAKAITVYSFSSSEIVEIDSMNVSRGLELPDKTVLYLAKKLNAKVLSGDSLLRKVCEKNGLEVMGIIWLFDIFLSHKLISYKLAVEKMNELLSFNSRLPINECQIRIKNWTELL